VFAIYKKEQGKWTRGLTMGAVATAVVFGALWLGQHPLVAAGNSLKLGSQGQAVLTTVGVGLWVLGGLYLAFWVSYLRPRTGDFFIAVEGEMKKVSWSSTKEVIGSTQVVVFTLVFMAVVLLVVDVVFCELFYYIGVLQYSPLKALFGGA
jgi:preprotein translocase SecE subunit